MVLHGLIMQFAPSEGVCIGAISQAPQALTPVSAELSYSDIMELTSSTAVLVRSAPTVHLLMYADRKVVWHGLHVAALDT